MSEMKDVLGTGSTENKLKRLASYVEVSSGESSEPLRANFRNRFSMIMSGQFRLLDFSGNIQNVSGFDEGEDESRWGNLLRKGGALNVGQHRVVTPVSEYMGENLEGFMSSGVHNYGDIEMSLFKVSLNAEMFILNEIDIDRGGVSFWLEGGYQSAPSGPNNSGVALANHMSQMPLFRKVQGVLYRDQGGRLKCSLNWNEEVLLPASLRDPLRSHIIHRYIFRPVFWSASGQDVNVDGALEFTADFLRFEKVRAA